MKKIEFLREIVNGLQGKMSKEDIDEVVADYGDLFDSKKAHGMADDKITEEIGSPAMIVRTILSDEGELILQQQREKVEHVKVSETKIDKENEFDLASMGRRIGAYVIDVVSIALVIMVIGFISFASFGSTISSGSKDETRHQELEEQGLPTYKYVVISNEENVVTKTELYRNGKRIFEGSISEYRKFIGENNISRMDITEYVTVKKEQSDFTGSFVMMSNILFLAMLLVGLNFVGIITAFELWLSKGYTLGKWLLKIRVVTNDGQPIGFLAAFLRDGVMKTIVNAMTSGILNVVSLIWGCSTLNHQTAHDAVAKTQVINVVKDNG